MKPNPGNFHAAASGVPPAPFSGNPTRFVPLQSQPVKDAIYRAMVSGALQRWKDGTVSGYAVPSRASAANGCRAVTYTVDQIRDVTPSTINACR